MLSHQVQNVDSRNITYQVGDRSKNGVRPFEDITAEKPSSEYRSINPKQSFDSALKYIFPEHKEETRLQRARLIMGEDVSDMPDEELEVYLTEFHLLVTAWLDDFEKQVFIGLTLQQMLRKE
ncbi:MAG: hypothetical protein WCO52_04255 [bacterium]